MGGPADLRGVPSVPRPPERFTRAPWSATRIGQFIRQNLSIDQRARLAELTRAKKRKTPPSTFVLLRVPRPSGGHHIVGVRYDQIRGYHPLARAPGEATVTQFRVERRDPGFLLPRGGGGEDLRAKRVLLIGCGAVGGHLAMELARCGIGHLTCVDPDTLQAANAHRHVLGSPPLMIEPHKAALLALEIKQRYPWTSTDQIPTGIGQALAAGMVDLARYDLVIAATGDHNLERALNARLFATTDRAPLLFTWLEPLGLGGHAVVVPPQRPDAPRGCFDCLFTADPADPAPILANRAAFAAPGQDFAQETAGCGQTFTPYSSLDALRTAELAVRLAVDTLRHGAPDARLRAWKGDAAVFRQAGYQTSARYDLDAWPLEHDGAAIVTPHCRVCGES